MIEQQQNPLLELKRIEGELHFERGVTYVLKEISRGANVRELAMLSEQRVKVLTDLAERLKRMVR